MKTFNEVIEILSASIDRDTLESFVVREWVRPQRMDEGWQFEDIDIARIQLIRHLLQDIEVNEAGVDIALSLLDQLYGSRAQMRQLMHIIAQQPAKAQSDILLMLKHG